MNVFLRAERNAQSFMLRPTSSASKDFVLLSCSSPKPCSFTFFLGPNQGKEGLA